MVWTKYVYPRLLSWYFLPLEFVMWDGVHGHETFVVGIITSIGACLLDIMWEFSFTNLPSSKKENEIQHKIYKTWIRILLQNCSDLPWEKIVLVIEKNFRSSRLKAENKIFEITWTIYSNSERSEQYLVTECFFNSFLEVSHI